jgi:endonuclease YncB( thermonuclease family)
LNSAKVSSGIRRILLAAIVAAPVGAAAAPWIVEGHVVGVTDGDTIKVLDAGRTQHVVRLGGIDAPERAQPFGRVAKDALSTMVFDRRIQARCWKRDRYGREVCGVFVGARDVGLEMVREGYAWHYKELDREQSPRIVRRMRGPRRTPGPTNWRSCFSIWPSCCRRVFRATSCDLRTSLTPSASCR